MKIKTKLKKLAESYTRKVRQKSDLTDMNVVGLLENNLNWDM